MSESGVPQLLDEILRAAKAQGLNQQTLARRAGLSAGTLSRMKTQDDASLATLNRLAAAVGLRLTLVGDDNFTADVARGTLF